MTWPRSEENLPSRATKDGRLDGITDSMDMSLSKLQEIERDREARHTAVHGATKSQTQLSNWPTTNYQVIATFPSPCHSFGHGQMTVQKLRILFITTIVTR